MTPNTYEDGRDESGPKTVDDDRYIAFETDDDTVVIYDTAEHSAWIESTTAVSLASIA